jgi:hypothetical protein
MTKRIDWHGTHWLMLGLLALLQALQFVVGFRMSADDAGFVAYAMGGWDTTLQLAQHTAEQTGRISQYLMSPLNAAGAWLAGEAWGRWLILALYYGQWCAFLAWGARLLQWPLRGFFAVSLVLMLALHPLLFHHTPPNAYPLQLTVPILVLLLCRWQLLRRRSQPLWRVAFLYGLQAIAASSGDFPLIFLSTLLIAEHVMHWWRHDAHLRQRRWLGLWWAWPKLCRDIALVLLVMAIYLAYRWQVPSQYEGNTLDISNLALWLQVAVGHVLGGTSAWHWFDGLRWSYLTASDIVIALLSLVLTYWLLSHALRQLPKDHSRRYLVLALIALLLALYTALPASATSRMQSWCSYPGCVYLDSRLAYLWLTAALVACIAWLVSRRPSAIPWISGVVALAALLNVVHNAYIQQRMAERSAGWLEAERFACSAEFASVAAVHLAREVDREKAVMMHPHESRPVYWKSYIEYLRRSPSCHLADSLNHDSLDEIVFNDSENSQATQWLKQGWSIPESWGTWSEQRQVQVELPLQHTKAHVRAIYVNFNVYLGPSISEQKISVLLNEQPVGQWSFDANKPENCCRRGLSVPDTLSQHQPVMLTFIFDKVRDPSVVGESPDPRKLAMGLHSIELEYRPQALP